jgi:imidazolonepropionase-like amidohydrolase/ABC-type multidrug transport system permease subunit
MKPYLAQIRSNLRLMGRDRSVLFFQLFFPLIFFGIFSFVYGGAKNPAAMAKVVCMVLVIGVLGSGFFGAGMRAVSERESGILRRFKVAPVGPAPIIVASMVAGLVSYLPVVLLIVVLAHFQFGMPFPSRILDLLFFVAVGSISFRAMGMIIASVVNSMQESQIVIQLLYLPMLFLSGVTFPAEFLPPWLQNVAQFLPATYLNNGLQALLITGHSLLSEVALTAMAALLLTAAAAVFLGIKLFRWEKEEKTSPRAKLWIPVVLAPFIILGVIQSKTKQNVDEEKIVMRNLRRNHSELFQNVRVFVGDGKVIQNGAVLTRSGKIERVFETPPSNTDSLNAEVIDASGKTLLPGLIDMHVHLGAPGGAYADQANYSEDARYRELAAYLYSGVTAVRSTGDTLDQSLKLRASISSGRYLGAELFVCGPMFTAAGGHGTEYAKMVPENMRGMIEAQMVRIPKNAAEARTQVDELKARGVDGIKAILETGSAGHVYNRLDSNLYREVVKQALADGLPVATHTGDNADVSLAIDASTSTIEHGSFRELIPEASFVAMKQKGMAYDPTMSVIEALRDLAQHKLDLLDRSLLQAVAPRGLIDQTRSEFKGSLDDSSPEHLALGYERALTNLKLAYATGVTLITGSDAGNPMVIHGPTVQRELTLWVQAGIPPTVALQAATLNAARALRADKRFGAIKPGLDATFIVVEGNPLSDISQMEHVTEVVFHGERIDRAELFDQKPKD